MNIVTREQWGARQPTRITPLSLPVSLAITHHTVTGSSMPATQWRNVQDLHMDVRGWSDVAYNWGIANDGTIYEGRGWDRVGGATGSPWDAQSLSFCWIGNFHEGDRPTDVALEAFAQHLAEGVRLGKLSPLFRLTGHRDHSATACCGDHLYKRLPEVRARVTEILQGEDDEEMRPFEDIANGWRAFNRDEEWAIRLTQEMLRAAGYRPGAPDGKKRPMLFDALKEFGAGDDPTKLGPPAWRRLVAAAVEFKCPEPPKQSGSAVIDSLTAENADLKRKLETSQALNVEQARRISAGIDALGGAVRG